MIFRNILIGAILVAATAFAQPADSTTDKTVELISQDRVASISIKKEVASIKKRQTIRKPATTWSKIKDLFE